MARVDLGNRFVQGLAPRRAGGEHLGRLFVGTQQGLTGPASGALGIHGQARRLCSCRPLF